MEFHGMFLLKDSESHNSMPGIKTIRKTGRILHNVSLKKIHEEKMYRGNC